ncbi:MAG: AsmA family protein [candidate division Zixibacteria bacterium]|nr:AsmA family protein [candidate division Zixibacteria bacterium]
MKKLLKILLWLAGILAVLIILAVVGLKLFFPSEKIRAMAVEEGSARLGRPIEVAGLDISIWGGLGLELEGVQVGNPEGITGPNFLSADRVDLKLQLLPLISGDFRVDRLIIDAPTVQMTKSAVGEVNYDFVSSDTIEQVPDVETIPDEAQAAALVVSFDELEINNGRLSFVDDSSSVSFELIGFNLATSLEYPEDGIYRSAGRLQADTILIRNNEPYPPLACDLNYRVVYNANRSELTVERIGAVINQARFKVTGEIGGFGQELSAALNVQSEQLPITELLSLLPPGQREVLTDYTIDGSFSLDADLNRDPFADNPNWHYTGSATLNNLEVTSSLFDGRLVVGRCLVDFKPDNVRMNIEQGSFDGQPIKGYLVLDDFESPSISGELAGGLDLALLVPFLPAENAHQLSGKAELDLKFSGPIREPERLLFTGNLVIDKGSYNSVLVPQPIETFDLDAYFENRLLKIRRLGCQFGSGQLTFTGRMTDLVPYLLADSNSAVAPDVEANVKGEVDLALAGPYLPAKGNPQLSGTLALDVGLAGNITDLSSFRAHGTVSIAEASYFDSLLPEPVESLDAELILRPDTIEVTRLAARFTSSDVSFTGMLIRPFPYFLPILGLERDTLPKPLFLFELYSQRFDTDRLFPEAVPGAGGESVILSSDSISTLILPDIEGRGTVRADTVIYCQVEMTQVEAKIKIKDRRIECYDAGARVYSGAVTGKTIIDLSDFSNPHYTGEFNATQIEAKDFVSRFSNFGEHLFGKGNFEGGYNAHGWEPEDFLNSLTVEGDLNVRDGRLVTSGAVFSAISKLASTFGETFDREQTIRNFATRVTVKNGRVRIDELTSRLGEIGDVKLNGSYGFDESLEYTGTLVLSQAHSRKLSLGNSERAELPFRIGGTMTSPKLEFDLAALAKQAGESAVKDAAKKALKDLFKIK